jgi:hypothetical protein
MLFPSVIALAILSRTSLFALQSDKSLHVKWFAIRNRCGWAEIPMWRSALPVILSAAGRPVAKKQQVAGSQKKMLHRSK